MSACRHVYTRFDSTHNVWRCTQCGRADHDVIAAYERGHEAGRREGIEAAAKWLEALGMPGHADGARALLPAPPPQAAEPPDQYQQAVSAVQELIDRNAPPAAPAGEGPKCRKCGLRLNAGEAKVFTVCSNCWRDVHGGRP